MPRVYCIADIEDHQGNEEIHSRLSRRGSYEQTMNDIIKDLLDIAEGKVKK